MLHIDDNEPVNLSRQKDLQVMGVAIDTYKWQQEQVELLIWHENETDGLPDTLVQITEGIELVVRYYLCSGRYQESSFPLTDAETTIPRTLEIIKIISRPSQK